MNLALVVAAGLIAVVGVIHSYLGEVLILIPLLRRSDLPRIFGSDVFTRRTLRFSWHLTSVVWWGVGGLLLVAARAEARAVTGAQLGAIVAATCLASAAVAGVGSRGRHLSWVAFLVVGALVWVGTR